MKRISLRLLAPIFAISLLLGPAASQAGTLSIEAFYGHYQGSGVAENSDSLFFGVTVRDLDVRITPEAPGFAVEWTSVIRGGGNPDKPDIRKRTQTMSFLPSGTPGVFDAVGATDPRSPDGLGWASVQDNTLSVHVMRITAAGGYVIQTYNRTLDGTGMQLKFVNVADGEPSRQVDARLVKVGN
jgi:hypothetical protein